MIDKAVFPLSADPITKGHLDLIKRSLKITQNLYVLILNNLTKSSTFSLEERKALTDASLSHMRNKNNLHLFTSENTLTDFCNKKKIFYIIRGIRTPLDVQNEREINNIYLKENPKLEFIYLLAKPEFREVSSSLAKALFERDLDTKHYFPLPAKQALEIKKKEQYKLIVTGVIASGKNFVCEKLTHYFKSQGVSSYEIDFDKIVNEIYENINLKKLSPVKKKLCEYFDIDKKLILTKEMIIQKVFLKITKENLIFENLVFLQDVLSPVISNIYKKKIRNKKGIILLNAPLAAEYKMLGEANNNLLYIKVSLENQKKYLYERDKLPKEILDKKILAAKPSQEKLKLIKNQIKKDGYGKIFFFNNNLKLTEKGTARIAQLGKKIIDYFKIAI